MVGFHEIHNHSHQLMKIMKLKYLPYHPNQFDYYFSRAIVRDLIKLDLVS